MSKKTHVVLIVVLVVIYIVIVNYAKAQNISPFFCKEGETRSCGIGACKGTTRCIGGVWSDECEGAASPVPEICGNKIDDDCNGVIDDCGNESINMLSYIMIISGVAMFIIAIVISKIQARRMKEEYSENESGEYQL